MSDEAGVRRTEEVNGEGYGCVAHKVKSGGR